MDIDAAIGYVVAHGDQVDRARLSYLRTGARPAPGIVARTEVGQATDGGWPATWDGTVASIDATCFRLGELDDLGALDGPAARQALRWLADRQDADGGWDEDPKLADVAPAWARPGDPEARLYLTAIAGFWLTVAGLDARPGQPPVERADGGYPQAVQAAAGYISGRLHPDGTWPSYLAAGWWGAAVLHRQAMFYDSARMQLVLGDRLPGMSPADVASLLRTLRQVGVADDDWLVKAGLRRLADTQRTDGGWPSDDGPAFDVHTTLTALRAAL